MVIFMEIKLTVNMHTLYVDFWLRRNQRSEAPNDGFIEFVSVRHFRELESCLEYWGFDIIFPNILDAI